MSRPEGAESRRGVTEFSITYFGLTDLEADALIDFYAQHAYRFAKGHNLKTPAIGSKTFPTDEDWAADGD